MIPLFDTQSSGKFPFWVTLIILINVYVFYLELTAPNFDAFVTRYALISAQVNFSDLTTLTPFVSSQFIHGSLLHIISNMLFLWVFGRNVEAKWGLLFPVFYLLSGVAGVLAQFFTNTSTTIPTLGASAAIAGILGAYLVFFPFHKIKTLIFIFIFITIVEIPAGAILLYWFVSQVVLLAIFPSSQGGVAYTAHIVGFITGLVISNTLYRSRED